MIIGNGYFKLFIIVPTIYLRIPTQKVLYRYILSPYWVCAHSGALILIEFGSPSWDHILTCLNCFVWTISALGACIALSCVTICLLHIVLSVLYTLVLLSEHCGKCSLNTQQSELRWQLPISHWILSCKGQPSGPQLWRDLKGSVLLCTCLWQCCCKAPLDLPLN